MRIVFDTNVFISAVLKSGLAEDIIEFAVTTNLISLITSEEILAELRDKLLTKFDKSEVNVDLYINYLKGVANIVEVTEKLNIIKRDPDDNKILECALAGVADLIVSMDQDLIKLKTFRGIGIVHPKTLTWTFPEYFAKNQK